MRVMRPGLAHNQTLLEISLVCHRVDAAAVEGASNALAQSATGQSHGVQIYHTETTNLRLRSKRRLFQYNLE